MTGRPLTRALVAAVAILAAVVVLLVADAIEPATPTPTGTTAPRPLP